MTAPPVAELSKTEAGIDRLRIGDVTVDRVADMDGINWSPQAMFDLGEAELMSLMRAAPPESVDLANQQIRLSFNSYLIRTPDVVALVDCGAGNGKERPDRPSWHRRQGDFLERLASLGIVPEDIDLIVNTHLHADHVGWNTVLDKGTWRPTFPRARYVTTNQEIACWSARHAADPSGRTLHGAFADSISPLLQAGCLTGIAVPAAIAPGLTLEPAFGHSPGMAVVRLKTAAQDVLILADVIHHPLQLARAAIGTKFCEDPPKARVTRAVILTQCASDGTIVAPYHFPAPGFGRVRRDGADFAFVSLHDGPSVAAGASA